jgi:hypothetical protein
MMKPTTVLALALLVATACGVDRAASSVGETDLALGEWGCVTVAPDEVLSNPADGFHAVYAADANYGGARPECPGQFVVQAQQVFGKSTLVHGAWADVWPSDQVACEAMREEVGVYGVKAVDAGRAWFALGTRKRVGKWTFAPDGGNQHRCSLIADTPPTIPVPIAPVYKTLRFAVRAYYVPFPVVPPGSPHSETVAVKAKAAFDLASM